MRIPNSRESNIPNFRDCKFVIYLISLWKLLTLKIGILLFGIPVLLRNCEREKIANTPENNNEKKV